MPAFCGETGTEPCGVFLTSCEQDRRSSPDAYSLLHEAKFASFSYFDSASLPIGLNRLSGHRYTLDLWSYSEYSTIEYHTLHVPVVCGLELRQTRDGVAFVHG